MHFMQGACEGRGGGQGRVESGRCRCEVHYCIDARGWAVGALKLAGGPEFLKLPGRYEGHPKKSASGGDGDELAALAVVRYRDGSATHRIAIDTGGDLGVVEFVASSILADGWYDALLRIEFRFVF